MNPKDRERTYKPFYHLYDIKGEKFVTKGQVENSRITAAFIMGSQNVPLSMERKKRLAWIHGIAKGIPNSRKSASTKASAKEAFLQSEIAWRVDDGTIFITEKKKNVFSVR